MNDLWKPFITITRNVRMTALKQSMVILLPAKKFPLSFFYERGRVAL